jgi:hypothetical protein
MNSPNVNFNIDNQSFQVARPTKGVHFVGGITEMGPVADPSEVITSWQHFQKVFGGLISTSDFPLLCKRALDRGSKLRVSRVCHYSDPTDASTLTATKSEVDSLLTMVFSADFVASNAINVDINGEAITAVNFTTDSATTLGLVASAIAGLDSVTMVRQDTTNRTLLVVMGSKASSYNVTAAVTGGASQASITVDTMLSIFTNDLEPLATLSPKNPGEAYDNMYYTIDTASNGQSTYFNLTIGFTGKPELTETYPNLLKPTNSTTQANFLDTVKKSSLLVSVTYEATIAGAYTLTTGYSAFFNGGSDGNSVTNPDYVGDSAAKTGIHAFSEYDDSYTVCFPEISDSTVHVAGIAYAENRRDLSYLAHLSNSNLSAAAYISARAGVAADSPYVKFYGGGLYISDPVTGEKKAISEMGDVLGVMSYSDEVAAEWFSPAGLNRGVIFNALGVVNNYGAPGRLAELNQICNAQVNMVVQADNRIYLNSDFTGTYSQSKLSFGNIVKLMQYIQRSLRPIAKRHLNNPNDISEWKFYYNEGKPFMDSLISGRALYDYAWDGDQFVNKIDDVQVNNKADLDLGKYKVKIYMKTISPMIELTVTLVLTPTDFSFEDLN